MEIDPAEFAALPRTMCVLRAVAIGLEDFMEGLADGGPVGDYYASEEIPETDAALVEQLRELVCGALETEPAGPEVEI